MKYTFSEQIIKATKTLIKEMKKAFIREYQTGRIKATRKQFNKNRLINYK